MGLYRDPYSKFGQLTYEMWRAIRLVVDTGIHSKGWTRQQAIDYFRPTRPRTSTTSRSRSTATSSSPGQALAYKIGELKIKELRAYAQKELGPAFDSAPSTTRCCGHGAVPLDLLEKNIKAWVAESLKSGQRPRRRIESPPRDHPEIVDVLSGDERTGGSGRHQSIEVFHDAVLPEKGAAGAGGVAGQSDDLAPFIDGVGFQLTPALNVSAVIKR